MKDIEILKKSIDNSDFENKEELLNILKCVERNLKNKKYGLVWEEKPENIKEDLKNKFVYLEEDKEKRISKCDDNLENILIEGDNLESLMTLQYTHKGLIDVIYIDPPYNTGNNDFIYNDTFIDKDNSWRHSSWLSFMKKRLVLGKDLMAQTGVIFISIGDDEFAQLKLLCDEIFGESNFLTFITRRAKSGGNKGTYFSPQNDYILVYAKDISKLPEFSDKSAHEKEDFLKKFNKSDCDGKYCLKNLFMNGLDYRPNQRYFIECPDGSKAITPELKSFRYIEPSFLNLKRNNKIEFKKVKNSPLIDENGNVSQWNIYTKQYLHETLDGNKTKPQNLLLNFLNREGSDTLKKLDLNFSFSKPVSLIKFILSITNNKKAIVLDYFAGSGTTGHAVIELNKEDGGNRRFILCTNNENNICEDVTYERINKVINGYTNQKKEEISGIPSNLRYYRTKKIEKTNNIELDQFNLLNKTLELIQIKENVFEIIKSNSYYLLLSNDDKIIGLYSFGFIDSVEIENMLDELIESNKENRVAYVPVEDVSEIYDYIDNRYIGLVRFEKMPKELIEIYNKLNRN